MATLKIDNKEYDLDTLSDECKAQLASIQFVECKNWLAFKPKLRRFKQPRQLTFKPYRNLFP